MAMQVGIPRRRTKEEFFYGGNSLLDAPAITMPARRALPQLTLIGTPRYRPFRCVWFLEELKDQLPANIGLRIQHLRVEPQSEEARANHPMGKIPALKVKDGADEFTMIESAAINTWLGDRMREYLADESGYLVPRPGSAERAIYETFVQFIMAEVDSSGLWIHRKLESLGEKKAFGAVRYALLPARLQFDRAMVGVRAQLEKQQARNAAFFLVGGGFTAADVLLTHCCDWAEGIDNDKGKGGWFSKYADDAVFQDYLRRMRSRPAYLRAKTIQDESPVLS